ncbi:MAG: hypothetical protein K8S97_04450 [Anaerolineae bacterium]|nr:hypothetical protein [Anaerolineae bacterium]
MKRIALALLLVCVLILGAVASTSAATRPTIITFDSALKGITLVDAEAGSVATTLTWHVSGLTDEYRVLLHSYVLDTWQLVLGEDDVPLEASGSRVVVVEHPLTFSPPTYLLSVVANANNAVVDQRTLSISYAPPADAPVLIEAFDASVDGVAVDEADASKGLLNVLWTVTNRPPHANLVFEQQISADEFTSVELPRDHLWVPSTDEGPVQVAIAEDADAVMLRLSVVDLVTEDILVQQLLVVSLVTEEAAEDADAEGPDMVPAEGDDADADADADAEEDAEEDAEAEEPEATGPILAFSATPDAVEAGAAVSLTWEIEGTGGVTLELSAPTGSPGAAVVNAQSPKGSAEVYLPAITGSSVTFTLYTDDRAANEAITLAVTCTGDYFFGPGEGCPSTSSFPVGMSYQLFEGGQMLWRSDSNEIFVLYTNGTAGYYQSADYAAQTMPALDEMPPLDRFAPTGGFGKVWANAPGVQDKLGWALSAEQGYTATVQHVHRAGEPLPQFVLYLTLPAGNTGGIGYGLWRAIG